MLVAALCLAAGLAAAEPPTRRRLSPGLAQGAVGYEADPALRLRPLDSRFVAAELGRSPTVAAPPPTIGPAIADVPAERRALAAAVGAPAAASARAPATRTTSADGAPKRYHCVDGHQTEDPASPPCNTQDVADNGGPSYSGVTADEVRAVWTVHQYCVENKGNDCSPSSGSTDVDQPFGPTTPGHTALRPIKALEDSVNLRYQTWGRRLHLYVQWVVDSDLYEENGAQRAAAGVARAVDPFAFVNAYSAEAAEQHRLSFRRLSGAGEPAATYQALGGYLQGLWPSREQLVDLYSSYVCSQVVGHTTQLGPLAGQPLRLGLVHADGEYVPAWTDLAAAVAARVRACGGDIVDEEDFPTDAGCEAEDLRHVSGDEALMGRMVAAGVTTVLWTGCISTWPVFSAKHLGFRPTWVVLGDDRFDVDATVRDIGAVDEFDGTAVVVTPNPVVGPIATDPCRVAIAEVLPDLTEAEAAHCGSFENLRRLATAIQAAGPRLTPASAEEGLTAAPHVSSTNPAVPGCFYLPGDPTCPRDAQVAVWRAGGQHDASSTAGCWASLDGGARHLPGTWGGAGIAAHVPSGTSCTLVAGSDDGGIRLPTTRSVVE